MDLPQATGRTSTVFRGVEKEAGFNLHSYIAHHDGRFFAIWSSSRVGEEDPDQLVRFATSDDGHAWRPAQVLAADPDGPEGPARWIARGLYVEQRRVEQGPSSLSRPTSRAPTTAIGERASCGRISG